MATVAEDVRADPVLRRIRAALGDMYGARLERAVLYGSRARGEQRPDSDYDVAVFLRDMPDRWAEFNRLADLRVELLNDAIFLDAHPYSASALDDTTPIMWEIRRDGVDL